MGKHHPKNLVCLTQVLINLTQVGKNPTQVDIEQHKVAPIEALSPREMIV